MRKIYLLEMKTGSEESELRCQLEFIESLRATQKIHPKKKVCIANLNRLTVFVHHLSRIRLPRRPSHFLESVVKEKLRTSIPVH